MNKKIAIPVATIALAAGTLGIAAFASAASDNATTNKVMRHGPSQEVRTALDNNDYAAFKEVADGTPLEDKITEENFSKFVEAHKLMDEGKRDEAKTIMDELGLKPPKGGHGHGPRMMDPEKRAKLDAALDAGDYSAWKEAEGDGPMADKITAENFSKFAEAHKLHEAGKNDEAKAIMDELGLKPPHERSKSGSEATK